MNQMFSEGALGPCLARLYFIRCITYPFLLTRCLLCMHTHQTILDGHLQHFDAEIAGQSSNMIKAALGLHSQVGASFVGEG